MWPGSWNTRSIMTFLQARPKWQPQRCILSMRHWAAARRCMGARLFGIPPHGVDRLGALTGSTPRVYLCFDSKTRRGEVSVRLYMLCIQAYPSRLLRMWEAFIWSENCFLHSKKVQVSCIFLTSVCEGACFQNHLASKLFVQKKGSLISCNCTLDVSSLSSFKTQMIAVHPLFQKCCFHPLENNSHFVISWVFVPLYW